MCPNGINMSWKTNYNSDRFIAMITWLYMRDGNYENI